MFLRREVQLVLSLQSTVGVSEDGGVAQAAGRCDPVVATAEHDDTMTCGDSGDAGGDLVEHRREEVVVVVVQRVTGDRIVVDRAEQSRTGQLGEHDQLGAVCEGAGYEPFDVSEELIDAAFGA